MRTFENLLDRMLILKEKEIWQCDKETIRRLDDANRQAIDGLDAIGALLNKVGLSCGREGCVPVHELTKEAICSTGWLIQELAGISNFCQDRLGRKIYEERNERVIPFSRSI